MPLVRVSLRKGKSDDYKKAIGDGVYRALRETFAVPDEDRFVTVSEHSASEFQFSKTYMDIARTDDLVFLQITVSNTRTIEQKKPCLRGLLNCCRNSRAFARRTCSSTSSRSRKKTGRSATALPDMREAK
jgi:4-oxalocrotonate tautomerase